MNKIQELQKIIDEHHNIVFFGGAGVSTESGIPDFRSVDGLYNQKYDYPPETILSHTFFVRKPGEFYRFYKERVLALSAKPNPAHKKLAEMESVGKLRAVVTQNIDGLHQAAGAKVVYELHGSVHRNNCMSCGKFFDASYIAAADDVPLCDECGSLIKPDVVLYEEGLDSDTISASIKAISTADVLMVGGTSLVVYPAAGLIDYFRGDKLVLLNKGATARNTDADLVITEPIGEVLSQIRI